MISHLALLATTIDQLTFLRMTRLRLNEPQLSCDHHEFDSVETQRLEQQCYLTTLGTDKLIRGHVAALMADYIERNLTNHGRRY